MLSMKPQAVLSTLALVAGTVTSFAADADPVSSYEWNFSTSENPAEFTPVGPENPFGATWTADIDVGVGTGHSAGVFNPENPGAFGTQTGMWDILSGSVTVTIDLMPATTVDYTLKVTQFANLPGQFPFSMNLTFSLPGQTLVSSTSVQTGLEGDWIESTYVWQDLTSSGPITLTIFSDPGRGFLLDNLAVDVSGILVPVPEPTTPTLLALGTLSLLTLGRKRR